MTPGEADMDTSAGPGVRYGSGASVQSAGPTADRSDARDRERDNDRRGPSQTRAGSRGAASQTSS